MHGRDIGPNAGPCLLKRGATQRQHAGDVERRTAPWAAPTSTAPFLFIYNLPFLVGRICGGCKVVALACVTSVLCRLAAHARGKPPFALISKQKKWEKNSAQQGAAGPAHVHLALHRPVFFFDLLPCQRVPSGLKKRFLRPVFIGMKKKKKVDIWRRVDSRLWQPLCSESAPFSRILHRRPCRRLLLDWPISWRRTNGLGLGRCCQRLTKKKLCCRHRICPLASAAPRTHRQEKPPNRRTTCKPKSAGPAPNRRPRNKKGKKGSAKKDCQYLDHKKRWCRDRGGYCLPLFRPIYVAASLFSFFYHFLLHADTHPNNVQCDAGLLFLPCPCGPCEEKKRQRHAARKKRERTRTAIESRAYAA